MKYMSIAEAAKWNILNRCIQVLCAQERVPTAYRISNIWAIQKDAEKPIDVRVKSRKHRMKQNWLRKRHLRHEDGALRELLR